MILRELFKKSALILEGGNLASHNAAGEPTVGYTGVPGTYSAGKIDSKNRAAMQPAVKQLLVDINNLFTRQYGRPIWSPELVEKEVDTFISGSSKWFMQLRQPNPNFNPQQPPSDMNPKEIGVTDKDFQRVKKKVGDIDTQIDRRLEPQIEEFLHKNIGANIGSATLLGTKKGSDQWLALWQLNEPPITLQVDLEFSDYTTDARGFEIPTEWAQVSHGSAWEDLELGIKGVFRQWLYRSLAKIAPSEKYIARMAGAGKNKGIKLFGGDDGKEPVVDMDNPPPPLHDANFSFAVASVGGGGVRAKYRQPTPEENVPLEINGVPVMVPLTTAESAYIKDMSSQFEQFFGVPAKNNETKMMAGLVGTVELMKQFYTPEQQQVAVQEFLKINFGKGAQMIDADDPTSDFKTKMSAIDYVLDQLGMQNLRKQAIQMAKEYESAFNAKKQPQPLAEAEVKAQLRKGMPHLHDLKSADFLDLLDEIHDGNGNFKLQNIPLNVKVDGFGGRFGKNAEGKPFMGTSRTEPRYQAGFVAYHKQKGTTDPEVLGRAQLFDQLFNEMMNAIQLVDGKLGPDFLVNKQVTCEVLYLPFATETDEGKLKFVGIHYDKLPDGVHLALVPFRVVDATTGEDLPDSNKFIKELLKVGSSGSVMFIDNSLTQKEGLDVTALVPPLENIEQFKAMLASKKRDQANEVKIALEPVKASLEQAIINDPNIIGKDLLGQDYEGIVINSRLGPIKVTSQEQRDVITAKNTAKVNARTERPRVEAKTAVVAIGSFIGHKGHEELFNYTINKAKEVGGDPYLFIGNAEGKDDPIPPAVKVQTWHKLYPQYAQNISTVQEGGALIQKVKHELINPLPGKPPRYDNVIIMVGEDRAGMNMPNALMKAVNKFQGYEHVKVSLEVTPRGTGISGTALRNSLKNDPPEKALAVWSNAFDVNKLGVDWIEHLMDITRKGMGIQEPQQPVQPQQPVPVAEHRLLNALIRPESTEIRLDEFDLFKKGLPMKVPAKRAAATSAEMRKFFQSQANKEKPGLKPQTIDRDNPQKVYVKYAEEEIEDNDAMSRMARNLTGNGSPIAKAAAQRDKKREQQSTQSHGRAEGPKWNVAEEEIKNNHWYDAGVKDATRGARPNPRSIQYKLKANHPEEVYFYMQGYKSVKQGVAESNVFTDARMNAIKAGEDTFVVHGKTYQVTGDTTDEREAGVEEAYGPYAKPSAADLERIKKYKEREAKRTVPGQLRKPGTANKSKYDNDSALSYFSNIKQGVAEGLKQQYLWHGSRQKIPMYQSIKDEITEAFDYPYKLKWEKSSYGDIDASATLDDGNYLNISFNRDENQDGKLVWNVEFDRNYSQAVTGEGDAQRVFATVLSAIQIFIKKYKPLKLAFGASKEVDQGQNSQSRARLYDSLVQRYARAWGYRVFRADTGNLVVYEFSRIQKPKAVGEDYNNRFATSGVAEARMSAAQRLWNAEQKQRAKSDASLARTPSSIPKPEPKKDENIAEKLKTGPAAHFTPKDAHVKRGQFVGGEGKKIKGADGKACWDGYRYNGTENGSDKCVKVSEDVENIMAALIDKIIVNEATTRHNK